MSQGKSTLSQELQQLVPTKSQRRRRQARPEDGDNSTAFPLTQQPPPPTPRERVFLRRMYFLNPKKTKFLSLGYYPAHNYDPCVEIRGSKRTHVVLTKYYLSILSQHVPKLCECNCANEIYKYREMSFRLQTVGKNNVCKLTYDKHSISF